MSRNLGWASIAAAVAWLYCDCMAKRTRAGGMWLKYAIWVGYATIGLAIAHVLTTKRFRGK